MDQFTQTSLVDESIDSRSSSAKTLHASSGNHRSVHIPSDVIRSRRDNPPGFKGHNTKLVRTTPSKVSNRSRTFAADGEGRNGTKDNLISQFVSGSIKSKTDPRLTLAGDKIRVSPVKVRQGLTPNGNRLLGRMPSAKSEGAHGHCSAAARHCDACAIDYLRYWLKQQNAMPTTNLPTSAEEKPPKETVKAYYEPLQLLKEDRNKEHQQIFLVSPRGMKPGAQPKRQVPTVQLPKKGMVKLTGLAYELDNPQYYDTRKEQEEQRDHLRYWEEWMGPALPTPTSDLHRGWLIKDRRILRQLKQGVQQLEAERDQLEEKLSFDNALHNTPVGGLLQFEMPEVPTMNNNFQKFTGAKTWSPSQSTPQPQQNNGKLSSRNFKFADRRQKSKSAIPAYNIGGAPSHLHPSLQPKENNSDKPVSPSPTHSEQAYLNYVTSPRQAFVASPEEELLSHASPRSYLSPTLGEGFEASTNHNIKSNGHSLNETFSLHQLLTNAQHYHLTQAKPNINNNVIKKKQSPTFLLPVPDNH